MLDQPIHSTSFTKDINDFLAKASLAMPGDKHWRGKPSFRVNIKDLLLSEPIESLNAILGVKSSAAASEFDTKNKFNQKQAAIVLNNLDKAMLELTLKHIWRGLRFPKKSCIKTRVQWLGFYGLGLKRTLGKLQKHWQRPRPRLRLKPRL